MSEFGFRVKQEKSLTGEKLDEWYVDLPKQYDEWTIAGDKYGDGVPRLEAIDRMKLFIEEAEKALASLERKREQNG